MIRIPLNPEPYEYALLNPERLTPIPEPQALKSVHEP